MPDETQQAPDDDAQPNAEGVDSEFPKSARDDEVKEKARSQWHAGGGALSLMWSWLKLGRCLAALSTTTSVGTTRACWFAHDTYFKRK